MQVVLVILWSVLLRGLNGWTYMAKRNETSHLGSQWGHQGLLQPMTQNARCIGPVQMMTAFTGAETLTGWYHEESK